MVRRLGDRSDQQLADAVASGRTVSEIYLQYPPAESADEMTLYRSMLAAMRSADGRHDEVQQAIADVMRSWDDGLLAEIDDRCRPRSSASSATASIWRPCSDSRNPTRSAPQGREPTTRHRPGGQDRSDETPRYVR